MDNKNALITGVSGQDGAYLAKHLIDQGYEVYGGYRRTSSANFWRLNELGVIGNPKFKLIDFDLTDLSSIIRAIDVSSANEVYNLAAQSFVAASFHQPITTAEITGLGATNVLEAIKLTNKSIRFYQASTSEMFGLVQCVPQTENTPFYPRSPYGVAKLYAHWTTINYREAYGLFSSSGILFNHESPLRGLEFVTRKITDAVAKIKLGHDHCLELGNIDAKRDWGHAKDYVIAMHRMLQHHTPDTFVIATGQTHTVREFVQLAFAAADIQIEFKGAAEQEAAFDLATGKQVMRINPNYYRPSEVDLLIGDATKAQQELDWKAHTSLENLCREMVSSDIQRNLKEIDYSNE